MKRGAKVAHLDVERLLEELDTVRAEHGPDMSWREVAGEIGVSPSTITRMRGGKMPNADNLVRMLEWVGGLSDFVVYREKR